VKQIFLILTLLALSLTTINGQEIPYPDNDMLYTEFTAVRTSPWLKKGMKSSGYLAMNGLDRFIFNQLEPVPLIITRNGDEILFKKGAMKAVAVSADLIENQVFLFFDRNSGLTEKYDISTTPQEDKTLYTVTPRSEDTFEKITFTGKRDIIYTITILFNDGSTLNYTFSNSVTGTPPDERYFN
jgi:hypothetical protein